MVLSELRVRNLALIAQADLEFCPGLTVLSGETGAGKTALLSSLGLLIGERGDATLVGPLATEARVEAVMSTQDGELIITRRISAEGRSRCTLDDQLVTVGALAAQCGPLVDLYGQHEHQSLLRPAEQLRLLDAYGGPELAGAYAQYQAARLAYSEAAAELKRYNELEGATAAQREQAAFALREIDRVCPVPGEYEELAASLPRLQNSERLAAATTAALAALREDGGALEQLELALAALRPFVELDPELGAAYHQLNEQAIVLAEASTDIARQATRIDLDPEVLERTLERLGALDGLARRFGPGLEQVFALQAQAQQLLAGSEDQQLRKDEMQAALTVCTHELEAAAQALSKLRHAAASSFLESMTAQLAELALTGVELSFETVQLPFERWQDNGSETWELLYRAAPAAPARPLAKIASGGELSRVMLAAKSLLAHDTHPMTLVFDEIDAGIGGATAHAVAKRLAALATVHQVIVITHLAQIAACAHQHFLVQKTTEGAAVHTTISPLTGRQRISELARMLSGSTGAEALAHAEQLLADTKGAAGQMGTDLLSETTENVEFTSKASVVSDERSVPVCPAQAKTRS